MINVNDFAPTLRIAAETVLKARNACYSSDLLAAHKEFQPALDAYFRIADAKNILALLDKLDYYEKYYLPVSGDGSAVWIDGAGDVEIDHGGKLRARAEEAEKRIASLEVRALVANEQRARAEKTLDDLTATRDTLRALLDYVVGSGQPRDLVVESAKEILATGQAGPATNASQVHEITRLRTALADAITCPKGVIPDSATGLLSPEELDAAEARRPLM